jgi:hypothetical protein
MYYWMNIRGSLLTNGGTELYLKREPSSDKPELKIEDLWYRFALSFLLKSIAFLSEP